MTRILIPTEKLHEGYNECKHKIYSLLQSSQILYNEKQFVSSLALSILASEEMTKIFLLNEHMEQKIGITDDEWNELTIKRGMHKIKLTKIQQESIENLIKISDFEFKSLPNIKNNDIQISREDALKYVSESKDRYAKFAGIKNDCFYVNWNSDWSTFTKKISNDEDQAKISYFLLIMSWYEYYELISIIKYGIDNTNIENFRNHPHLQEFLKFQRIIHSKEFHQIFNHVEKILENF